MFLRILSIVILPFPTELLSTASHGAEGVHSPFVGTMLVTTTAVLGQQWALVRTPALQAEEHRGEADLAPAVILIVRMAGVLVSVVALPTVGLLALVLLLPSRPLEGLVRSRRARWPFRTAWMRRLQGFSGRPPTVPRPGPSSRRIRHPVLRTRHQCGQHACRPARGRRSPADPRLRCGSVEATWRIVSTRARPTR